ncbi:unnamed protein product [Sympodiomycopsis kandeliae]
MPIGTGYFRSLIFNLSPRSIRTLTPCLDLATTTMATTSVRPASSLASSPSASSSNVVDAQSQASGSGSRPSTSSPMLPLSAFPPQGTPIHDKPSSWDFYKNVLGSPKYVVAPMVSGSELPWRLLSREFGADLCYSPMINSRSLVDCLNATSKAAKAKQKDWFDTELGEEGHGKDKMLVAQLAGHDPDMLLQAAKYVEDHCLAVDLNLGCPQHIAKRGRYGSFLQEDWPLIFRLINILHLNLKVPVTAKMRVFPDVETTVAYAKMLQHAGAQIVTVHGRTREQKGHKTGLADWKKIRAVKEALDVPVFANGNILYGEDLADALEKTGADGVMSAEGNLYTASIFSSPEIRSRYGTDVFPYLNDAEHPEWAALPYIPAIANMYLDRVVECQTKTEHAAVKGHMFKILKPALDKHRECMSIVGQAKLLPVDEESKEPRENIVKEYREAVKVIEAKLKDDQQNASFLQPPSDQVKMPPEYRYVPHWLCQPYFRPELPPHPSSSSSKDKAKGSGKAAGMIDPNDEQSRGEKRIIEEEEQKDESAEQKKIRLEKQINEANELKSEGNTLFAKKELDEACTKWLDAIAALPPVEENEKGKEKETEEKIMEVSEEEALCLQSEEYLALQQLQRQEVELRTTLLSNVAEGRLRLEQWRLAIEACDQALSITPRHIKSLSRRATANEQLNTHSSLSKALQDLETLSTDSNLPPSQLPSIKKSISRVKEKESQAMEIEKQEMMDKLKGLGNTLLGKFGLSTDNFKFEQNQSGSWGMKFQR